MRFQLPLFFIPTIPGYPGNENGFLWESRNSQWDGDPLEWELPRSGIYNCRIHRAEREAKKQRLVLQWSRPKQKTNKKRPSERSERLIRRICSTNCLERSERL